ncbi:membrane protein YczE [Streptacidiphilus griseoplanus]|uniref:membrane protein YczE n=1 Tax=Peterkaempfera griseoplana TaxID=66896 RepID=UPI000A79E16E|nr:hypothetical protein [Peterkaempfera griseoplana]
MDARRLTQLYAGLVLYGASAGLQVRSGLGLDPWDVFHQGVALRIGWSIGEVSCAVGAVVLLLWIPLRQRPGLGTVSNVVAVGTSMDALLWAVPAPRELPLRIALLVVAVLLNGLATGLYIAAGYGPGPRDGLMTGLHRRTGRSIRLARTGIEVAVLASGWLLGGTVGVGTVLYAVAIGPVAQFFLRRFARPQAGAAVAAGGTSAPAAADADGLPEPVARPAGAGGRTAAVTATAGGAD